MWFGVHTVQNNVFRILIKNAHLELKFKIRTMPSCENSHSVSTFNTAYFLAEYIINLDLDFIHFN